MVGFHLYILIFVSIIRIYQITAILSRSWDSPPSVSERLYLHSPLDTDQSHYIIQHCPTGGLWAASGPPGVSIWPAKSP